MKIKTIIASYILFLFLIIFIFLYWIITQEYKTLVDSVGQQAALSADGIIKKIDLEISERIEEVYFHSSGPTIINEVESSNNNFANLTDIQDFIDYQEAEWSNSANKTVFILEMSKNAGSKRLNQIKEFYSRDNYSVFSEIFVTNKYGAVVSMTSKTSDYRQDDEDWWQEAKKEGISISKPDFDASSSTYGLSIATRIDDDQGNFIGVIKENLNFKEIEDIIEKSADYLYNDHYSSRPEIKIIDQFGNVIYQSKNTPYNLSSISNDSIFPKMTEGSGYIISSEDWLVNHEEDEDDLIMFAYSKSEGNNKFKGFGWISLIEYEEDKILSRENSIRIKSIIFSLIFTILSVIGSFFIANKLIRPIDELKDAASKIGKGELKSSVKIASADELGNLAHSINLMAANLRKYKNKILSVEKAKSKLLQREVGRKTFQLNRKISALNNTKTAMLNMMSDLKETNEKLKDLGRAKSDFLNIVSHEMKTPLTAINAHLAVIDDLKANLDEQELSSLEVIKRNNYLLKSIIDNILELSRIESGKFELSLSKLDLGKIINEVKGNLEILARKKKIRVITDVDDIPNIFADEMRIREILNNLISNSIKFTEKGLIKISAEKQDQNIVMKVTDTGIGIPSDKIKNLFQKFYQVDSSVGRRYGGSGLGLAITKQLVELQGGRITVESTQGAGSTFTVIFPIKKMKGGVK